jgi:8-oxo-dGTP pyrophosphatase MutT (NUDIX family)
VTGETLIRRLSRVEARCSPREWRWAAENRDGIRSNWAARTADKPKMFNGRVLLISDLAIGTDVARADYFEADFADFLGWRDLGYPDRTVTNGFAAGALQGADGAYICGVMANGTANGGRIYFPAGTPDPTDLRPDGSVDLSTSVIRELEEETLLEPGDYAVSDEWIAVHRWPTVAFLRPIRFTEPAAAVAERIRENISRQDDPELSDVLVVRGPHDIDPGAMPAFLQTFLTAAFSGQG